MRYLAELERNVGWRATRAVLRLERPTRLPTDDRRILEEILLRALAHDPAVRSILFVGCNEHSSWYPRLFRLSRQRFDTVDPNPEARRHGARRHRVATLQDLGRDPALAHTYDAVIVNGVFGYGIDTPDDKQAAIDAVHRLLRPEGLVIVGYRDLEPEPDVALGDFDAGRFRPVVLPGLGSVYHRSTHHNAHAFAAFRTT